MTEDVQPRNRITQTLSILAVLVLFYAALWVLRREVRTSHYQDVFMYLRQISFGRFGEAFGMALLGYGALTLYDTLGLRHIKRSLAYWRIALTSFIAYTFGHNIGAAFLTGGGIRYRLYSAWGLSAGQAATVILICASTFWIGFFTMGSVFFFLQPPDLPPSIHVPFNSILSVGVFCLLVVTAYLLSTVFFKKTIRIAKWHFPTPTPGIALGQMGAGCLDWLCSGTALFLLLPASSLSFPSFMSIYLLAQLAGFASQVPGGLGILETIMVVLLSPMLPASDVLGAMLAFRLAYYLIPFVLGLFAFAGYEIVRNKEGFKRALQILNRWAPDFAPHLFALLAFLSGAILLVSNASPESGRRLTWLNEFMPLGVLESSHFITGLVGAGLLVAARGLQQRLEVVYYVSLVFLGFGTVGCLLKGFDYQEALFLMAVGAALLVSRGYFPRRGSLFQQRYPPIWVTAILFVWLGSLWIGFFNYRYEDYTNELWTTFDILEDTGRFLRSDLGSTLVLVLFSIIALFTPTQPETELPESDEKEKAFKIASASKRTYGLLSRLGDKALFFNRKQDTFIMYAVEGRSWVAVGDPVGEEKEQQDLALRFKDLCLKNKAWPVLFGVDQDHFEFYLDMGLTVLKVGEEAQVSLAAFQVENLSEDQKNTYQRFKENGDIGFEVLQPPFTLGLAADLKKVSEEWLSKHRTREKGFLTGFFREEYLFSFPLALVKQEGKPIAFASLHLCDPKEEASLDLLRSSAEASPFVEDYLRLEIFLWAKERGYRSFSLGMAPLLDAEQSPLAPFTQQMSEIFSPYAPTGHLQEIRKEKERFTPQWAPKYMALSGNLPLLTAFNNIRSLVSQSPHEFFRF